MLGPVLGGLLAAVWGWRSAFVILGLAPVVVAPFFLRFMGSPGEASPDSAGKPAPTEVPTRIPGVLSALAPIWWPFTVAVLAALTIGSVLAYLSVYLVGRYALSPTSAAMILALVRGIGIVGATLGGVLSDRLGTIRSLQLAVGIAGPALLGAVFLPFGPLLMILLMVYGIMANMREVPVQSLVFSSTSQRQTATVMGLYFFVSMEGTSLIVPPVGYVMDRVGLVPTFIGLAALTTLISVLALVVNPARSSPVGDESGATPTSS
jgi:predicted MFS family arabinose efflux permease